eukprot:gene24097-biopygen8914
MRARGLRTVGRAPRRLPVFTSIDELEKLALTVWSLGAYLGEKENWGRRSRPGRPSQSKLSARRREHRRRGRRPHPPPPPQRGTGRGAGSCCMWPRAIGSAAGTVQLPPKSTIPESVSRSPEALREKHPSPSVVVDPLALGSAVFILDRPSGSGHLSSPNWPVGLSDSAQSRPRWPSRYAPARESVPNTIFKWSGRSTCVGLCMVWSYRRILFGGKDG